MNCLFFLCHSSKEQSGYSLKVFLQEGETDTQSGLDPCMIWYASDSALILGKGVSIADAKG